MKRAILICSLVAIRLSFEKIILRKMREAGIIKDRSFKERSCVGIGSGSWFGFFQQKVFKKYFTIRIEN